MSHKPHWHPKIQKTFWADDIRELLGVEPNDLPSLQTMSRADLMRLVDLIRALKE